MLIKNDFYSVEVLGDVLCVELFHAWEKDTTLDYCHTAEQLVRDKLTAPWGVAADLRHWSLHSGVAFDIFLRHHRWTMEKGLKYQAVILPPAGIKRWRINSVLADDYQVKSYIAKDNDDALLWLRHQGLSVKPSD